MVLLVAGGVVAAIPFGVFVTRWFATLPALPPSGPEVPDLGPESPAVADLLGHRCPVSSAAAAATLLDLAARRRLLLFEAGPGKTIVRVRGSEAEPLTDYEEQLLDLVKAKATGGSAPLEAIELEQSDAVRWRKEFAKKV